MRVGGSVKHMHTPLDLLAHLKKGIDRSEEIIDLSKIILNEVRAHGTSGKIDLLFRKVLRLYNDLYNVGNVFSTKMFDQVDEYTKDYIITYINYLTLVSIPYEIDLLNEISSKINKDDIDDVKRISKAIALMNELRTVFEKIENY